MFFLRKAIDYKLNDNIPLSTPIDDVVFTVFDTETTGFDVATMDRLIEIGAVQVKGTNVLENETFHTYVNPNRDIPPVIVELTNITKEKVQHAPMAIEALQQFFQFVEQKQSVCFVGHYISFDLFVMKHELRREKMKFRKPTFIDTLDLIGFIAPSYDMRDLERYAQAFGTRMYERHSAIGDALTTAYLFVELLEQFRLRGYRTWGELLRATDSQMRSLSF
ncbi:3'-5' exoribonuclease [Anoxybacillus sp. LAT_35]|uniref:3'-5' exonuclease n=1 Tax=Anoxybacillus TaxID=150247 RepID=UPI001EDBEC35|nr:MULTISPECIES: exonuclease domain-containing protein [Anoxybacillus]MCG5025256.1 3'-5' exoribonuclease [Anoxybacillus flavithermus]MCG6199106.1 3'-5' exoribonuclease [Anoxybacillus sp. LAT_38]MCG3085072.1 3'-5' exoribonuclease [Anoxybacillus sp. LAT27]MCG6171822.1 3'-5' exoribonuclease [Anoxybacillus sp. LAT_11]MCG6174925.1 3'-5' exoribonuclease [Anoxybacillus sp. LAT_31]